MFNIGDLVTTLKGNTGLVTSIDASVDNGVILYWCYFASIQATHPYEEDELTLLSKIV